MVLKVRAQKKACPIEKCDIGECMYLLGGAWTPNIIWLLSEGARRFSELKIYLSPISAKMLSTRLKDLEEKCVVTRNVMPTTPPTVEYELTELGKELLPAIGQIARIGAQLKQKRKQQLEGVEG